jgi:probable addiction module antidote protein
LEALCPKDLPERQSARNRAAAKSPIALIALLRPRTSTLRHAIGAAIRLYNISDIAKVSGLERPTIYRAFEGDAKHPNFRTVLSVLDAMGFQLHAGDPVRRGLPTAH